MTKKNPTPTVHTDRPCSTIHAALCACMADVEAVGKNRKNKEQGYAYRGIDDLYNSLHPIFARHRVFVTCDVLELLRNERTTKSGSLLQVVYGRYRVTFHAEDGSSVSVECAGEAMDSGDKATNKASSAALKYALMQTLLIPTEDDKDSEVDSFQPAPVPAAPRRLPTATPDEIDRCAAAIRATRSSGPYQALLKLRELSEEQALHLQDALGALLQAGELADERPELPRPKPAKQADRGAF